MANTKDTSQAVDETNAVEYVDTAMRGKLDDLILLTGLARGEGIDEISNDEMLGLGIAYGQPGPIEPEQIQEEAAERLDEYPLCVEATTTFEVVLGTGGPDDRLLFECTEYDEATLGESGAYREKSYEIDRVLYRYSWAGSADRVLGDQDRVAAEDLARRVVPELAE